MASLPTLTAEAADWQTKIVLADAGHDEDRGAAFTNWSATIERIRVEHGAEAVEDAMDCCYRVAVLAEELFG